MIAGPTARGGTVYLDTSDGPAGLLGGAATWDASTTPVWTIDPSGGALTTTYTAGSDAIFATSSAPTITVNGTVSANSLTFLTAFADTFNNGTAGLITLGGGGTYASGIMTYGAVSTATTINTNVNLAAGTSSFNFMDEGAGTITVAGNITGTASSAQTINISSTSTGGIILSGIIADGTGGGTVGLSIYNPSTGTTTLSGANTFSGGILLRAGTLTFATSTAAAGTGTVTLGDASADPFGVTLGIGAGLSNNNPIVLNSGTTGTITLTSGNTGTAISMGSAITGNNNFTIGGAFTVAATYTGLINNAGTINIAGTAGGTINLNGGIGSNVTAINLNSNTNIVNIGGSGITVNASGFTINNNAASGTTAIVTVTGGVTGMGNLTLNNNNPNSITAGGIVFNTGSINNVGTVTNSGSSTGTTGPVVINSVIGTNVTGLIDMSRGALTLTANNTYMGPTTSLMGAINVNGAAGQLSGTSAVTIAGGGNLSLGDATNQGITNRINSSAPLTLGSTTGGGGLVIFRNAAATTPNSQSFPSLTVGGAATIADSGTTGTAPTLTFSGTTPYTRTVGGLLNVTTANFTVGFTNAPTIGNGSSVIGATNPILVGAILNGNDFIASGTSLAAPAYSTNTFTTGLNVNVTTAANSPASSSSFQSLKFNTAVAAVVTLTGTNTIESGGIVVGSTATSASLTGGSIQGPVGGDIWAYLNTKPLTISSSIVDNTSPSGLTYGGSGALTLSGANAYTGLTTVQGGSLLLSTPSANGTTTVAIPGNLNITGGVGTNTLVTETASQEIANTSVVTFGSIGIGANGNRLALGPGNTQTLAGIQTALNNSDSIIEASDTGATAGTATLIVNNSTNYTYDGLIRNTGGTVALLALTKQGSGKLTIANSGDNALTNFSGATTISGGTLALVGNGNLANISSWASAITDNATLELDNTSLATAETLGVAISGSGGINVNAGTAAIVLKGAGTFMGNVNVNTGTLRVTTVGTALGASTNTVTVANGAALDVGVVLTNTNALTINGVGPNGFGALTDSSVIGTYAGAVTLGSNSTIGTSSTFALTVSGAITGSANLTTMINSTGALTLTNANNTGTITNAGFGTGTTTITTLGTNVTGVFETGNSPLTITSAVAAANLGSPITSAGAGLFTLTGGISSGSNLVFNANNSGGITVTGATTSTGTITNSGTGFGTVILTGALANTVTTVTENAPTSPLTLTSATNAYTGATTVTQGTLNFAGTPVITAGASGLGDNASIVLGGATTMGVLNYTGAAATITRTFTINAGGGEIDSTTGVLTFAGQLAPNGPLTFGGASGETLGSNTTAAALITGTNPLIKTGAGTLTLSTIGGTAAIQSAMPINIIAGTLAVDISNATTANLLGTGPITITPGATLAFALSGSTGSTYNNAITIGGLSGTAVISTTSGGPNNASGAITFAAGSTAATILRLGNSNTAAATLAFGGTISGTGTIQLNPSNTGSPITLSGAQNQTGSISNIGSSTSTSTLSGPIGAGINGISQAGANPFTVSSAIPLSANLNTFASTGAGLFTFTGGFGTNAQPLTFDANSTGGITVSTGAVNNAGSVTNSGTSYGTTTINSVVGTNVTGVTENSATSPLILNGVNTTGGTFTDTTGVLDFGNVTALPGYPGTPAAVKITVASGGILTFGYGGAGDFQQADVNALLTGAGTTYPNVSIAATGASVGIDTTDGSASYTAVLANPPGTASFGLVKVGTNTLTLGNANTYSGATWVQNGTLSASVLNNVATPLAASSLGAPTTVPNGTIALGYGTTTGTLSYTGPGETTDRVINLAGTTGGGGLDQSGSGDLHFTSPMTFTGVGAKTLTLSGSTASDGYLDGNLAGGVNGAAGGALALSKTGTGTWHLTASGNTAQNIAITGGTLDVGSPATPLLLNDIGGAFIQATGNSKVTGTIQLGGIAAGVNNGPDIGQTTAGATLDLTGLTLKDDATVTQTYVDFYGNQATGITLLSNTNTYSIASDISSNIVVVSSINSVTTNGVTGAVHSSASSLGAPTTVANGTLYFTTAGGATLRYVGTGETTDRAIVFTSTTGGQTTNIDQSGTGPLKFLGNVTASGAATHILGLTGSTTSTGEMAGNIGESSTTNTTAVTKTGTGTWILSGVNTYTGATNANAGNLILSLGAGSGALANTAITINNGGTLSPVAGFAAGTTVTAAKGATLTLNAGGTLNLADGTIGNFTLNQNATFSATAANFAGGTLKFDIGATGDEIIVNGPAGALATSSNTNTIVINGLSGIGNGSYTLITAAGGSLSNSNFILASNTINVLGMPYTLSLSGTTTSETLTVAAFTNSAPAAAYWNGTTDLSWNTQAGGVGSGGATNWVAAATGSPDTFSLPGSNTNVYFTSNTATGSLSTTLDAAYTINSLTFTGTATSNTAGSTIAAGSAGTLAINAAAVNGNTLGNGITVQAGSGANSITAPVTLGATQTWTNNSTNTLSVTGGISGTGVGLTVVGAGTVVLGSSNSFDGGLTVGSAATGGVASISAQAALGTNSAVTLGGSTTGVGTLIYTGTGETISKTVTFQGTGGGGVLDQSGTGLLKYTNFAASTGNGAHTLTIQGSTAGTGEFSGALADNGTSVTTTAAVAPAGNVTTITVTSATGMVAGMTVSGLDIQPNTTISSIAGNVLTLNQVTVNSKVGLINEPIVASYPTNLTKAGSDTWTFSGSDASNGSNILVTGGTLNLTGSYAPATFAGFLTLQPTSAAVPSIVNVTGTATFTGAGLRGANIAGGVSVYNQSGGTVTTINGTSSTGNYVVAGTAGAYGMFNLTGGTYRVGAPGAVSNVSGGRFLTDSASMASGYAAAVMYVGGGGSPALLDNTFGEWFINGYSLGQVTVMNNGTIDHTGSSNPVGLFMDSAQTGGAYGVFNIAGGNFLTGAVAIQLGNSTTNGSGNSGFINLAAGTLSVGANIATSLNASGGNHLYINYTGGTLKATGTLSQWVPTGGNALTPIETIYGPINNSAVAGAPSFAGGMIVDTGTFTVTYATANTLNGASGDGVTQADLAVTGGSGYVGAPAVQFSAPASSTGVPASGYALMSGGSVTGIVITNPGVYAAGETPTITLTGGGAATAATVTSGALATANTSGGLTKLGTGTLVLNSPNSSFSGPVTISAGILQTNGANTLANIGSNSGLGTGDPTSNATNAASLVLDGGTYSINGTAAPVTTDRLFTVTQNGGTVTVDNTTGANFIGFVNSGPIAYTGVGARTLTLGGVHPGGVNQNTFAPLIGDAAGGQVSVTKTGTTAWILTNAGNSYTGPTTLTAGILSVSQLANGGLPSDIGASTSAAANLVFNGGTLEYTGAGSTTDRNYTFGNATTAVGATVDSEGTGPVAITGSTNAFINTAVNTQVLNLIANAASGNNQINGVVDSNTGLGALTGVTKTGAGTWIIGGTSTYSGATTLTTGTLQFAGSNALNGATPIAMAAATFLQIRDDAATITHTTNNITITSAGTVTFDVANNGGATTGSTVAFGALNNGTAANALASFFDFTGANGYLQSFSTLALPGTTGNNTTLVPTTTSVTIGNVTNQITTVTTGHFDTLLLDGTSVGNAINGVISDAPTATASNFGDTRITKQNTSTWTLAGASTYHGPTAVNAGTLVLSGSIGNSAAGFATNGTVITVAAAGTFNQTSAGAILNASSLTNSGTTMLAGTNSYTGVTTVSAGTLTLASTATLGNTAISVANAATLSVPAGAGTVNAGNNLTAAAGSTLTLNAGSIFTMVDGAIGTFAVNQNATMTGAIFTLAGATLNLELNSTAADQIIVSGATAGTGAISGTSTVNITAIGGPLAAGTYTIVTAPGIATGNTAFKFMNGNSSEALAVGPSTYNLTLQSTTTGIEQIAVSAGITNLTWTGLTNGTPGMPNSAWANGAGNNNFADSTPSAQDYIDGTAAIFQDIDPINGGNVSNTTVVIDPAGVMPGAVTFNNSAVNYTVSTTGTIGISGSTGLLKTGTGMLTLSSVNTYTGGTQINGGIVKIGIGTALGTGPIAFSGGTLQYGTSVTTDLSAQMSTAAGNLIVVDTNGNNVTWATALTSLTGTLTKLGAGTLTLSAVNTYTGNTTVNGGTLTITNASAGLGAIQSPTVTVNSGAILNLTNADTLGFTAGRNALVINDGTVQNNASGKRDTIINTITMTGGTLSGSSVGDGNTGAFSLNNGTAAVIATSDAAGNPATISANISTQTVDIFSVTRGTGAVAAGAPDLLISGPITPYAAGSNGITIKGTGIVTLSGANTYKGSTTLAGSSTGQVINANSTQALGNNTAALIMGDVTNDAATLNVNQNMSVTSLTVNSIGTTVNTDTITIASGKTLTVTSNVLIGPVPTAANQLTTLVVTGGSLAITTAAAGTVTVEGNSGTNAFSENSTLDLTGLTTATISASATGTILIGNSAPTNVSGNQGELLLPTPGVSNTTPVSTLTAGTLTVGPGSGFNSSATQINQLVLGTGLNTLDVNTINVGTGARDIGTITFANANGNITIRGAAGGVTRAALNIGTGGATTGTANAATNDLVDFTGHSADLLLSALNVGNQARIANLNSTFSFDTGTLDTTGATVGFRTGTVTTTAILNDTINLGGGTVTIGASGLDIGNSTYNQTGVTTLTGTVNVTGGTVTVANSATLGAAIRLVTNSGGATNGANVTGTLDITGGSVTVAGDIIRGTVTGAQANAAVVTLDGGVLDLGGHNLGTAAGLITNVNLRSGTLRNVAQINNGASISKTASTTDPINNTLTLAGTNSYSGAFSIASGIVDVTTNGGLSTAAPSTTVAAGTTLQLSGVTVGAEPLTLNGSGYTGVPQLGALVALTGTNTYGGAITAATNSTIAAAPSATLNLTGGINKNGTTVTFAGGGAINVNTVGIAGALANSDVVVSAGTAVTYGTGTSSTYNGPTTVSGKLVVNGSLNAGSNTMTVSNAGILAGAGTITSPTVLSAGATITAGAGFATTDASAKLALGATTLTGDATTPGTYQWKFNSSNPGTPVASTPTATSGSVSADTAQGANWDVLTMSTLNVLATTGQFNVTVVSTVPTNQLPAAAYSWPIAVVTGGISLNSSAINYSNSTDVSNLLAALKLDASALSPNLPGPGSFSLGLAPDPTAGEDIVINYTGAPEPTSLTLLGLGLGGLALRRRRRKA
jgi:autotransporter-associated beta strand protein